MPTATELQEQHLQTLIGQAERTFEKHALVTRDERSFFIAANAAVKTPCPTSIFCDYRDQIYVSGASPTVVFGDFGDFSHSTDVSACLRWIGRHTDITHYVAQKAGIGLSDEYQLTTTFDGAIAAAEIQEHLVEGQRLGELGKEEQQVLATAKLAAASGDVDQVGLERYLFENLDPSAIEGVVFGQVVAPRVVYAWAAVKRLCDLLEL